MAQKRKTSRACKAATGGVVFLSCLSGLFLYNYNRLRAATATLPIYARLVKAVEITVGESLDFGTLAVMTSEKAGRVRMTPDGEALVMEGDGSFDVAGGTPRAGRLHIRGAAFPISLSIDRSVVNLSNGQSTVLVSNFNFMDENRGSHVTITPVAGQDTMTVAVGASLSTRPGQMMGTYVGSARIYANFQ